MNPTRVPSPREIAIEISCSNLSLERPAITNRRRRWLKKRVKKVKRG